MYKSPVKIIQDKKASINFIKTVASPKVFQKPQQIHTTKHINHNQSEYSILKFTKSSTLSTIGIEITLQKQRNIIRCAFSYNNDTKIKDLIDFIKKQVGFINIVLKTKTLYLDYFLTLSHRSVKELQIKRLEVTVSKIKIQKNNNNLLGNLQIIKCVGTGGFSKVYLVRGYGKIMALKVINKDFIVQNQKQNIVQNERKILQKCSGHPFITQLYLSFQTKNYLFFGMEYCNGGQLFNLLRRVRKMTEQQAKFYFLQTLAAISHLHSQNILYRDLKPENIILDSQGHVRLADYGLSKIMKDNLTHSFCGSAEYMAPQMLMKKGHSYQIDYYCLGALLYELLTGLPPYYSKNQSELFQNIIKNELQFPQNIQLSKDLRKILMRLLQKNTDLRFKKVSQILNHPWLKTSNMQDVLQKKLQPPFKTQMFENNFDDADFIQDEMSQILKLQREKQKGNITFSQQQFQQFTFICNDFVELQKQIEKKQDKRLDFTKKSSNAQIYQQKQKQTLWRNVSMKSIDNSQLFDHSINNSQKIAQQFIYHRSSDKFKNIITASTHQYSPLTSTNNGYHSTLNTSKPSQINISKGHQAAKNYQSKLIGARSVPIMQKNHVLSRGNDRIGSPININNYINIYTSKSPVSNQINFNTNHYGLPQAKKSINLQGSFQKSIHNSINNLSQKQIATILDNSHTSQKQINLLLDNSHNSQQRSKFNSIQKSIPSTPVHHLLNHNNSQHYIKQNVYDNQNNNRGYLSNFKERFNPNPKVKKFYRASQKQNLNFINHPNNTYKN